MIIGTTRWEIALSPETTNDSYSGRCDLNFHRFSLSPTQDMEQHLRVLVHEVVHAISNRYRQAFRKIDEKDYLAVELMCEIMESGFVDFLRQNPEFVNMLLTQGVVMPKGGKKDRQQKHIKKSLRKQGLSEKEADSAAWATVKHPKGKKKR